MFSASEDFAKFAWRTMLVKCDGGGQGMMGGRDPWALYIAATGTSSNPAIHSPLFPLMEVPVQLNPNKCL